MHIAENNAPFTKILSLSAIIVTLLSISDISGYSDIGLWKYSGISLANIGEVFAAAFLSPLRHIGLWHLIANMLFLWYIGVALEKYLGSRTYIAGYILTLVITLISLSLLSNSPTAGMSSFGLALITFLAMYLSGVRSSEAKGAWMFVALNIAIGFFGNISLIAHIAGAISGVTWYLLWKGFGAHHTKYLLNVFDAKK